LIITKDKIKDMKSYFTFHQPEHEVLTAYILDKLSEKIDFKLKIQKASIQLLNPEPFAVLGYRRKQKYIFLEFYNKIEVEDCRVVKTLEAENRLFLNRIHITDVGDFDDGFVDLVCESALRWGQRVR